MLKPKNLQPIDKLGLPQAQNAREQALQEYCFAVVQGVEHALTGNTTDKEAITKAVVLMCTHKQWIARTQEEAFAHGATTQECVAWIVKNLRDTRNRPN